MGTFILNIIHRPEMVPEYAEKVTGQGKAEDIGRKSVLTESLDIFKLQQAIAHENGFRTTIQMTYASLFSDEAVAEAKKNHVEFGDEIGLTLLGLPCTQFREKYKTKEFAIWMFSYEDKKSIVKDVFEKFHDRFGFYPASTGSYFMDAPLINFIKQEYPSVVCAVAACWEEGPKAYRTTNNSWYTLLDGGPWSPWIPSRHNSHIAARNESEDSGIVAIPHLSRDLLACFDGNGSNFGTHPQNVLRGMIYRDGNMPYLFNLIDQYKALEKYNGGYSYNMMFVGPAWMNKMGRWEAPYELLVKSYRDCMSYYAELRDRGELQPMTMNEFASWFRANKHYTEPACALWKDILYGSQKQLFWYYDSFMRTCVDMNQGGALVDLRPYVARVDWPVGVGTKHVQDASYPFLIQSMYRAGYFTHYAGEGSVKSCKVSYGGDEVDLCLCRTKATYAERGRDRVLTLDPVTLELGGLTLTLQSTFVFPEDSGEIRITRRITKMSDPDAVVHLDEYVTACYGTTEYPEEMDGIVLRCVGQSETKEIVYEYKCREERLPAATRVEAVVPQISTRLIVAPIGAPAEGYVREGYAFSPMYSLGLQKDLTNNQELVSCLRVEKAD